MLPSGESERAALKQIVSDAVAQTLSSWREETLSALLARHKTTALDLRLAAPRLLLPENLHDPSAGVLVLDMGAIRMTSAMQPSAALDVGAQAATAAAAAAAAAEGGADLLELATSIDPAASALYDRYDLEVSSMQVLLAPAAAAWRSAQVQVRQRLHLVYQFGVSLQLHTCILPPDVCRAARLEPPPPTTHGELAQAPIGCSRAFGRASRGAGAPLPAPCGLGRSLQGRRALAQRAPLHRTAAQAQRDHRRGHLASRRRAHHPRRARHARRGGGGGWK